MGMKCEAPSKKMSSAFGILDARFGSVADADKSKNSFVISLAERKTVANAWIFEHSWEISASGQFECS